MRCLLAGAMLTLLVTPAAAQDDQATVDAITKEIKSQPADLDDKVKAAYKKNKKNAVVLTGMGRAFYEVKDTVNAHLYAGYALKANSKYAPAYILLGDLEAFNNDGGNAAQQYEQAIYFDPNNPDAYYKYASVYSKTSPSGAVAKLEELRAHRPDVAVDALAGRIYYKSNMFDDAIRRFGQVDRSGLEQLDLTDFAMCYYFTQKYDKSLEIAQYGLSRLPRDAGFNRLAFFSSTELKDYDAALQYADALFNRSDSAKISYFDYAYYGNTYSGLKRYPEAIEMYKKALDQEITDKAKRAGVMKQLADGYKLNDDYPNAIKEYDEFLNFIGTPTAQDYVGLAQLYTQYANTLEGGQRDSTFLQAEGVYNSIEEKFPNAIEYTTFMKARINSYRDPDTEQGLAKPLYEKLAGLIEPKEEKDAADNARLVECYRYLGYYNMLQKDTETANTYWNKILEIDPENNIAKVALGLAAPGETTNGNVTTEQTAQ